MSPALIPDTIRGSTPTREDSLSLLVSEWERATEFTSDVTEITQHPSFRQIVAAGHEMVPLLLRRVKTEPSLLVLALREITGEDPVPHESRGKISEMAKAWIAWGEKNHPLK